MSWIFTGTRELSAQFEGYRLALHKQIIKAESDSEAEAGLRLTKRWQNFLKAVRDFESNDNDPSLLPAVRSFGTSVSYHAFKNNGFTIIYRLDAATRMAIAVLFYENSTSPWQIFEGVVPTEHGRILRLYETLRRRAYVYWKPYAYLRPYLIVNSFVLAAGLGGMLIAVTKMPRCRVGAAESLRRSSHLSVCFAIQMKK